MNSHGQMQVEVDGRDFRCGLDLAAAPQAVYDAIASAEGLTTWWSEQAQVADAVGGVTRVTFPRGGWTELRVDRAEPPHRLEWTCVGQEIDNFSPTDEWVGTRISFELSERAGGTRLEFAHHGLAQLECIGICEDGWQRHLAKLLAMFA